METKIKWIIGALLVVSVAGAGYVLYDVLRAPRPVGGDSVLAEPAPVLRRAPVVPVQIKKPVKTFQGKTKANLKLPAAVVADETQQVIAATQVKANLRPQTVSTVANTETGAVESYVKTDPYPWFAIEGRGEAKIAYGYKYSHTLGVAAPVARLHLSYDVIRVKALTAGIMGTFDSDRDAFVGVGISYKW